MKRVFVFLLFYTTACTAASQTYYKSGDNALSRNIQKALINSEIKITQNTFQLVAVEVKNGKLLSIKSFNNDTSENFKNIRQAIAAATAANFKRKKRRLVILIPLFFIKRNSELPITVDSWTNNSDHYQKQQHSVLLPPLYLLSEGEKLRSSQTQ